MIGFIENFEFTVWGSFAVYFAACTLYVTLLILYKVSRWIIYAIDYLDEL